MVEQIPVKNKVARSNRAGGARFANYNQEFKAKLWLKKLNAQIAEVKKLVMLEFLLALAMAQCLKLIPININVLNVEHVFKWQVQENNMDLLISVVLGLGIIIVVLTLIQHLGKISKHLRIIRLQLEIQNPMFTSNELLELDKNILYWQ